MNKLSPVFIVLLMASFLTACVTQNYGNDKDTPIIENESSNNEIAMTRISLGLGYLKMGNTQQAKLNLEKAKRFSPKLVQVYTAFAHYYETVDEPELAIDAYEYALNINSQDADTLNNYGVFLCRQEKYAAAEKQMLKAIAIPSYILVAQSYENLALCQLKAKDFDNAQNYLEKAISHSPNRASSLLQMIRLQYAKSDYKLAQSYLYRYERSTRRFSANALALAFKVYEKQGNKRIAKNYGNMLVKMFPNTFEAKQYILNELDQIEADKLAKVYQASISEGQDTKQKKRIVMLSPKKSSPNTRGALSENGLKPIMPNSVMPTAKQKITLSKSIVKKEQVAQPKNKQALASKQSADSTLSNESKLNTENESIKVAEYASKNNQIKATDITAKAETKTQVAKKSKKMAIDSIPTHVIKKGEGLFYVSKHYNIVMKSIIRWNKLHPPYMLKVGDKLYLADPKSAAKN